MTKTLNNTKKAATNTSSRKPTAISRTRIEDRGVARVGKTVIRVRRVRHAA